MMSAKRILYSRRMYPANSLPFSVNNWRLIPVCNQRVGDENIFRQWEFGSVRYFGSFLQRWILNLGEEEQSQSEIKRIENYARINRERATIGLMMSHINCLTSYYLLDEKSKLEKDLDDCGWKNQASCRNYWSAVFEGHKTPLAAELEEKLKNKGISNEEFVRSFLTIYSTLRCEPKFIFTMYKTEAEDVLNAMDRLKFNDTQRECLRVLYSLHETYGWKI